MLRLLILTLSILSVSAGPRRFLTKNDLETTDSRIINGFTAALGQFPWQAALYVTREDPDSGFCGGSIISNEWILTSAHCLEGASSVRILTGLVDLLGNSTESVSTRIIVHEKYNPKTLENDIGLIGLNKPLTFDESTKATLLSDVVLDAGAAITISGFGETISFGSLSQILNYVTLLTTTKLECEGFYGQGEIYEEMICASPMSVVNRNVCTGDIGGPAIIYSDSDPVQVAIVSLASGNGCGNGLSRYTRIAYYRNWINQQSGI